MCAIRNPCTRIRAFTLIQSGGLRRRVRGRIFDFSIRRLIDCSIEGGVESWSEELEWEKGGAGCCSVGR